MVKIVLLGLLAWAQSAAPAADERYVGRFDCQVESTSTNGDKPYRELVTFHGWNFNDMVSIERDFDTYTVHDEARSNRPFFTPSGAYNLSASNGIGVIILEQTAPAASTFRRRGSHMVMDAGNANDWGYCEADIRQIPVAQTDGMVR